MCQRFNLTPSPTHGLFAISPSLCSARRLWPVAPNHFENRNIIQALAILISADDRRRYFTRLLDEGRLPEFCQYVCDQSHEIVCDYMSRATTPGESFYELAGEFQQKALHPDNNMMLEVLERNLPNH